MVSELNYSMKKENIMGKLSNLIGMFIGAGIAIFGIVSCFTGVGMLWGVFCIYISASWFDQASDRYNGIL